MQELSLRPAASDDREFILTVCRATMTEYHRTARGWSDVQIESAFVKRLDLSTTQIVLLAGEPVGILTVQRGPRADWLIRIGLLPTVQGRGVGTYLLRNLQERGAKEGRPVCLSVYKCNPSLNLYRRLGFQVVSETEIECQMRWLPPANGADQLFSG